MRNRTPGLASFFYFIVATSVTVLVTYSLCRRALVLSDEGYVLYLAEEVAGGKVLYRDLDAFVAPGLWLLIGALFKAFPPSVLLARMASFVCLLATAYLLYSITRIVTSARFGVGVIIAYTVLSVWAFPAWHFAFYSVWSVLAGLVALRTLLRWQSHGSRLCLAITGFSAGISLIFKQNYGVLILSAVFLALTYDRLTASRRFTDALSAAMRAYAMVFGSALVPITLVVWYFWNNGAFGAMVHALLIAPFSEFLALHRIGFPPISALLSGGFFTGANVFIYQAVALVLTPFSAIAPAPVRRLVDGLHVLLYYLPIVLLITGLYVSVVGRRLSSLAARQQVASVCFAALLFLGVFPRADLNHLVNVYQPILVVAAIVLHRFLGLVPGHRRVLIAAVTVVSLPYVVLAGMWYVLLVKTLSTEVHVPRGGVLVSARDAGMVEHEVQAIRRLTRANEPVLTMPSISMLNFLADRPVPGRYANLFAAHIAHDDGRDVARALATTNTRWIVSENYDYFADPIKMRDFAPYLLEYIRRHYRPAFSVAIDRHWFLERRQAPLPAGWRIPLAPRCALGSDFFADRVFISALLFDTIAHRITNSPTRASPTLRTKCDLYIPADSRLRFFLGYRQPQVASADARALITMKLHDEETDRATEIFSTRMPVTASDGWDSPPPSEHTISLATYAGKTVTLEIATQFEGRVVQPPGDLLGSAVTISDLALEHAAEGAAR